MAPLPPKGLINEAEAALEPAVETPIDATTSATTVIIRNFVLQSIVAVGAIITFLGLPDTSLVVRTYKMVSSAAFYPVLGMICSAAASGYILIRAYRKHRQVQTLALLPNVPDTVAIGPANPTVAVEQAVIAATVKIDAEGALPAAFSAYAAASRTLQRYGGSGDPVLHRAPPPPPRQTGL